MTSEQKYFLAGFGFLSVVMLFVGAGLVDNGYVGPDKFLWIQSVALFIGFFVLAGACEKILGKGLAEFKVTSLWWAALFAVLGYFARISALNDVNQLFHIDPVAVPMTLVAASVMQFFVWMKWPFMVVALGSLIALLLMWKGTYFDVEVNETERMASGWLTVSNLVSCALAATFISYQLDEDGRKQKLYRTAHAADFVSQFTCVGIDKAHFSVLFIGPEQRRILIAPKLPEPVLFVNRSPEFLQALKVPKEFPVTECILPPVDLKSWMQEISANP